MVWPKELLHHAGGDPSSLQFTAHLFGTRRFSTSYLYSSLQSCKVGIISSILQMRERLRETN